MNYNNSSDFESRFDRHEMNIMLARNTFVAILLLLIGAGIYATCRQSVIFLEPLRETKLLDFLKIDISYYDGNILTYFLLFCLPDILWYIALLLLSKHFYNCSFIVSKILFYFTISLPFLFEFLQYLRILHGTFDIVDIFFYSLTLLFFIFLWNRKKNSALLCNS